MDIRLVQLMDIMRNRLRALRLVVRLKDLMDMDMGKRIPADISRRVVVVRRVREKECIILITHNPISLIIPTTLIIHHHLIQALTLVLNLTEPRSSLHHHRYRLLRVEGHRWM